jgi:hypothetical protein
MYNIYRYIIHIYIGILYIYIYICIEQPLVSPSTIVQGCGENTAAAVAGGASLFSPWLGNPRFFNEGVNVNPGLINHGLLIRGVLLQ